MRHHSPWRWMAVVGSLGFTFLALPQHMPCAAEPAPPATRPATQSAVDPFKPVRETLGLGGQASGDVFTVFVPREELVVRIEGMEVPPAAGLASVFRFYNCPCGRWFVVGEFCALDYEVNDVVDALRPENLIRVASISNMFIGDRPKVMLVRFQGEGEPVELAKRLREALRWMGEQRMAPRKELLPR